MPDLALGPAWVLTQATESKADMWLFTRTPMWRLVLALGLLFGAAGAECRFSFGDDDEDLGDKIEDL